MASKDYILVDLIADVVDSMRATNEIDSFVENSGIYTINSSNELQSNEVVQINSVNYVVTVIDEVSFTIEGSEGLDFTGMSWKALAPYYEHGHIKEIANTLNTKNKGIYTYQKYPLIILFQDYRWDKRTSEDGIFATANANFAIANMTKSSLKSSERYDLNFRPVLFPLYDEFIEALVNIEYFDSSPDSPHIDHDGYERPYWGSDLGAKNKNILDDWIDAIELENTELKILNGIKNC